MKKFKPSSYELQTAMRWRDLENERKHDTHKLAGAIFKARAGQALEWRDWDIIRSAVAKWEGLQFRREFIFPIRSTYGQERGEKWEKKLS